MADPAPPIGVSSSSPPARGMARSNAPTRCWRRIPSSRAATSTSPPSLATNRACGASRARPGCVHARSEPYGADALTHLCLSKYLRLDPARSDAFVAAATALLDAGADPNRGFWTTGQHPEHETPLYGAAGVAHHAPLTRLLLERGADPNDDEAVYHSPETDDNAAMALLVETGRSPARTSSVMLIRKHDWHDTTARRYLLEHGADANGAREDARVAPAPSRAGPQQSARHHRAAARSRRRSGAGHRRRWPDRRRQGRARRPPRRARAVRPARHVDRAAGRRSPHRRVRDGRQRPASRPSRSRSLR